MKRIEIVTGFAMVCLVLLVGYSVSTAVLEGLEFWYNDVTFEVVETKEVFCFNPNCIGWQKEVHINSTLMPSILVDANDGWYQEGHIYSRVFEDGNLIETDLTSGKVVIRDRLVLKNG